VSTTAAAWRAALRARGFGPFIGVPCSYLTPFIDAVIADPALGYVAATNEGEALAIAAGAQLAGRRPVVLLQNSGLGNLVNPLTSLAAPFRIPVLLVVTWRGEPGRPDEPQHEVMGRVLPDLLALLGTAALPCPTDDTALAATLDEAIDTMAATGLPVAIVVRDADIAPDPAAHTAVPPGDAPSRTAALRAVHAALPPHAVVVATTGKTGREWFAVEDRPRNLYLVGSMGCAASVGLGIARETDVPVVVLDGDGAALMRLEAMATIGHLRPPNLVHVVLDNAAYDSTGAQPSISPGVDFPGIARACGYPSAAAVDGLDALVAAVRSSVSDPGPQLIHCRISTGSPPGLPRPTVPPAAVAARLRAELAR
jgi:phosphonopyruvate decarboxylase